MADLRSESGCAVTVAYESDQLTLLSEPRARATDPEPSRVAAESVRRGHARRLEQIAHVVWLSRARGCTAVEVWAWAQTQEGATRKEGTWRGAFSRAAKAGLIVPTGQMRDGCGVYVAANQGGEQ